MYTPTFIHYQHPVPYQSNQMILEHYQSHEIHPNQLYSQFPVIIQQQQPHFIQSYQNSTSYIPSSSHISQNHLSNIEEEEEEEDDSTNVFDEHDPIPPLRQTILTQQQAKSLRRWCRRLANKAEHDGKKIQLKQIATILALAHTTIPLFSKEQSPNYLQSWINTCRSNGADWYDQYTLSIQGIKQLRIWNDQIKNWSSNHFAGISQIQDESTFTNIIAINDQDDYEDDDTHYHTRDLDKDENNERLEKESYLKALQAKIERNQSAFDSHLVIEKDVKNDVWNIAMSRNHVETNDIKSRVLNKARKFVLVDRTNTLNDFHLNASAKGSSIHPAHTNQSWRKE